MRCLLAPALALAVLSLSLSSCSRGEEKRAPAVDAASGPAAHASAPPANAGDAKGVSAHCGAAPCRDYPTAAAHVRKLATPGKGPGCSSASIGRCGSARYVHFSDGFSTLEEYFDASGTMIAAHTTADIDPAGGWYGPAQSCEKVPDVVLCRDGRYLDAGLAP